MSMLSVYDVLVGRLELQRGMVDKLSAMSLYLQGEIEHTKADIVDCARSEVLRIGGMAPTEQRQWGASASDDDFAAVVAAVSSIPEEEWQANQGDRLIRNIGLGKGGDLS